MVEVDPLKIYEQTRKTHSEFLRIDLDVAITLADRARTALQPEVRERNRRNARRAYDTVVAFMTHTTITQPELDEINSRLQRLRVELKELGEVL
jgi:hypothetical protein